MFCLGFSTHENRSNRASSHVFIHNLFTLHCTVLCLKMMLLKKAWINTLFHRLVFKVSAPSIFLSHLLSLKTLLWTKPGFRSHVLTLISIKSSWIG